MKKVIKYIVIVLVVAILVTVGNYFFWNGKITGQKKEYESRIASLQQTLDDIGPLRDVYTIREEVFPGKEIIQEDLAVVKVPESMITEAFELDPKAIIGKIYKIGMKKGFPIMKDVVMEEPINNEIREFDLFVNAYPIAMREGDYVDVNIIFPQGEIYTIISHARVKGIYGNMLKVALTYREKQLYESAIIDYALNQRLGAQVEAVKYVEPGIQEAAKPFYAVPPVITAIIQANPNIATKIVRELNDPLRANIDASLATSKPDIYSQITSIRGSVISEVTNINNQIRQKLEEKKMEEELNKELEEEESYLESGDDNSSDKETSNTSNEDFGDLTNGEDDDESVTGEIE